MNLKKQIRQWLMLENPFISQYLTPFADLILRLVASGMMMTHGYNKLMRYSSVASSFPDPIGLGPVFTMILAILTEFFLPIFIILGLFTRWAALGTFVTMMVAGVVYHFEDPFVKKELALLYALVFFVLFLKGSGKWSLDSWIKKRWF